MQTHSSWIFDGLIWKIGAGAIDRRTSGGFKKKAKEYKKNAIIDVIYKQYYRIKADASMIINQLL